MNRREFFSRINPFREEASGATAPLSAADRNELFLQAMSQGIDPATVDPDQLSRLLGLKEEGPIEES